MKKLLFIGLYFLAFKTLNAQTDNQLKIITYNIWNGFDWGKDTVRRSNFQEWVRSQNPDIFALQELCAYTPEKLSAEAKTWGHSYSALLKTTVKGRLFTICITANIRCMKLPSYADWQGFPSIPPPHLSVTHPGDVELLAIRSGLKPGRSRIMRSCA